METPRTAAWTSSGAGYRPPGPRLRRAGRPSTRARAGCTWPRSRRRERWDDWVELSSRAWRGPRGAALHARPHHLLQLRVRLRAARLRGPGDRAGAQVRGQPRASRLARPQLRQGPGHDQPGHRPGPDPVPDETVRPARQRRVGAGQLGRGPGRAGGADPGRAAEDRRNEIMVHLGRPGEDGFTERVLASWGVDGHNSHTNVCSSGGRTGFQFWMGIDRPSPDHAHAKVIYLISAHLEAGHYFNPHAQRITEARASGAKVIVLDTRLSNTATHADYWLSPQPGSEAAINLAIANHLIQTPALRPGVRAPLVELGRVPDRLPSGARRSPSRRSRRSWPGCTRTSRSSSPRPNRASTRPCSPRSPRWWPARAPVLLPLWRSAAAGNLGGWQVSRTLFLISALLGAVATEGAPSRTRGTSSCRGRSTCRRTRGVWQELSWPLEYPLAQNEMSFLLPHFLKEGRGPAGHLLHPRLQPGVDQPRRADLDGGAVRRGARSAASWR